MPGESLGQNSGPEVMDHSSNRHSRGPPQREDGKLVGMEIPAVYRRLGLAREGDVWLVRLAMYGLTTSPRDWSQYRNLTLPTVSSGCA